MKTLLIGLVGLVMLTGCDLSDMSMARATKMCLDVNSTLYTAEYFSGTLKYKITCLDGNMIYIDKSEFIKITGPEIEKFLKNKGK